MAVNKKPKAENVFAGRVLAWFDQHGRHDLPWQKNRTPYRVWLAEVMLQQTQVATVMPYYQKFLGRFPDLSSLAKASLDEVLLLWAGLGYYSRARNLHRAAVVINQQHQGQFPGQFEAVLALPGIGRSTAGAILAQSLGQRHAILDGNVKRVLSRYFEIEGWYGKKAVQNLLWQKAEACTPEHRLADYTQAIMDLGATVCTRSSPDCESCPLLQDCSAYKNQRVTELPTPKPKKLLPVKAVRMLLLVNGKGETLLEKRPPTGIWGGLWSLPELALEEDLTQVCQQRWGYRVDSYQDQASLRHTFSHYHLDITPCRVDVTSVSAEVSEPEQQYWCDTSNYRKCALATPVANILQQYLK
ncbi:MAG: A/G-specific adenine glycosylase [Gammaproteobacteria bacterium]|nr:A/G-specific adenine glycosylase [Gammaproteobacteria bacterium]MCW8923005.1 A/G-specific adenine glycosylase [Gammaproteobacteria bacterium]